MARKLHFARTYGVRLGAADERKLKSLCAHTGRPASELIRWLIRTAQPVDVAPIRFDAPAREQGLYGVPDGGNSLVTEAGTAG